MVNPGTDVVKRDLPGKDGLEYGLKWNLDKDDCSGYGYLRNLYKCPRGKLKYSQKTKTYEGSEN
jgi:hypothetical protein